MKGHFFNSLEEILLEKYSPQIWTEIERGEISAEFDVLGNLGNPSLFYLFFILFWHERILFQFFGRDFAGKIFASDLFRDREKSDRLF